MFARAAYGTAGSNLPALMRALVACGWFGIQTWIGGEALYTLFTAVFPGWPALLGAGFSGHTTTEWLFFWGLNISVIYRAVAQHAGFHALRAKPERTGRGPGRVPSSGSSPRVAFTSR